MPGFKFGSSRLSIISAREGDVLYTGARCERRYKPGLESLQGSAGLSHVSCLSFFSFYAQRVGVLTEYSPFNDYVNVPVGGLTSGSPSRYQDDNDHQIMGE